MQLRGIQKVTSIVASSRNYESRGKLFWNHNKNVTRLVQIQKSNWCNGVYINIGAHPRNLVLKTYPPSTGYWAIETRPTAWVHRYSHVFERIETNLENAEEVVAEEAIKWLFSWIDATFEEGELRKAILSRKSWLNDMGLATAIAKDWASNKLGKPAKYYSGIAGYYST